MHTFRRKLLCDRGGQGAQGELGTGKAGHLRISLDRCSGAGEDEGGRVLGRGVIGMLQQ